MFGLMTVIVLTIVRLVIPFGLVLVIGSLIQQHRANQA
jgi:hypothetical protein